MPANFVSGGYDLHTSENVCTKDLASVRPSGSFYLSVCLSVVGWSPVLDRCRMMALGP